MLKLKVERLEKQLIDGGIMTADDLAKQDEEVQEANSALVQEFHEQTALLKAENNDKEKVL